MIILLLSRQRSGTGALGTILNRQPEIAYLDEIFHDSLESQTGSFPEGDSNWFRFFDRWVREHEATYDPRRFQAIFREYLDYIERSFAKPYKIIDVKYNSTHHLDGAWVGLFARPALLGVIQDMDIPVLHLTRRNLLKSYVSGLLAQANNVWHTSDASAISRTSAYVEIRELLNYLDGTSREISAVFNWLRPVKTVRAFDYAEMFDNDGSLSLAVELKIRSLGSDIGAFNCRRPTIIKQSSNDLRAAIENYAEVESVLTNTLYSWMLSQD